MALPTGEVQIAFIAAYRADSTLQGLIRNAVSPTWSIYDAGGITPGTPLPYMALLPITSQPGSALAMSNDAVDVYMQVSVFTQTGGFASARAIMKRVYALTHKQSFTLSGGFTNFFTMFQNEQEVMEPDGIRQMVVHRYKLMLVG